MGDVIEDLRMVWGSFLGCVVTEVWRVKMFCTVMYRLMWYVVRCAYHTELCDVALQAMNENVVMMLCDVLCQDVKASVGGDDEWRDEVLHDVKKGKMIRQGVLQDNQNKI